MTNFEIEKIEYHPYPETSMMLVTAKVELNGITTVTKEYYVPCIEIKD